MLARLRRKGNPLTLLVGMQAGAATLENSIEVLQKVENRATLPPSNYTTRYLSKGYKHSDSKEHMYPNVYSSNVHNSQTMEITQMSIDRWMDKEEMVMQYYSAIKKNEILSLAMMWLELEGIMLREISQSEKDKYRMISLKCGIVKTNKTKWSSDL